MMQPCDQNLIDFYLLMGEYKAEVPRLVQSQVVGCPRKFFKEGPLIQNGPINFVHNFFPNSLMQGYEIS